MTQFTTELADWVRAFCAESDRKREAEMAARRRQHRIACLTREIERVTAELPRRPSKIRHLETLRHQMRQIELEIAFGETSCP